jgi:hypothetical protein
MSAVRTVTVENPGAVQVSPGKGEHLFFRVTAVGPVPIFAFASSVKGTLHEPPDFIGHPMKVYEWVHLKNPSDIQQLEVLNILFSFLTSESYDYLVELRTANGSTKQTVLNLKHSGAPTETSSEAFTVVIT